MAKDYSAEIVNTLKRFFLEDDWHYDFFDEKGVFKLGINLNNCELKSVRCYIDVYENHYTVYAVPEVQGNLEKPAVMAELAEFLCRANYGLRFGCFELDFRDGEVRYRYSVNCEDGMPGFHNMRGSLIIPALTFEKYSAGLLAVILVGASAKQAIEMCKNK